MGKCIIKNKILGVLVASLVLILPAFASEKVYVGGMPFGVRFDSGEVTVIKTNSFASLGKEVSPAKEAGIVSNDIIKAINGKKINSINDVAKILSNYDSDSISLEIKRGSKDLNIIMSPATSDTTGKMQLGVMLKDSSAGIGTVTFIKDDSLAFGGLGHGICDTSSGKVLSIKNGYVSNVTINGINAGKVGIPGELKGIIDNEKCGKLLSNTEVGVFGIFTTAPNVKTSVAEVAQKGEIKEGKAKLLCTLDDNQRKEYDVEIAEICNTLAKTKNFIVKVTDQRLLEKTGGIVQGMSGSPIIQNGKLVGAVTHVLVNDPTRGYGIFIENMIEQAA